MIDFGTCKNCNRPIFFDWKGAHHVQESQALAVSPFGVFDNRLDFSKPECDSPEEEPEEELEDIYDRELDESERNGYY